VTLTRLSRLTQCCHVPCAPQPVDNRPIPSRGCCDLGMGWPSR
jgi:hypothetical protein